MNELSEVELAGRLERLGALKPAPEATQHALERVRRTLAEDPVIPLPARSRSMRRRLFVAAAVLLVASGLFAWWLSSPFTLPLAFADVHAAVKASGSLTGRQTVRVKGKPEETSAFLILGSGLWRMEESDGSYSVTDTNKHCVLLVKPRAREATLMQGVNTPSVNLYELLRKLPADASARRLPGKKVDGKDMLGFVVPAPAEAAGLKGLELTVWADAKTRMPVRIEAGAKDENDAPVEIVLDQLVFDKVLDSRLFILEAPAGYKLKATGSTEFPAAPDDAKLKDLVVTPRAGIGPVRFGMARAAVEKALGKPDGVEEVGKNGYVNLSYASRGFFVGVSQTLGVITISCMAQQVTIVRLRDFSGKTDKGIALGASIADVIRAYGKPDTKETNRGSTYLTYGKMNAWFTFFGDRLVEMSFHRPRG